MTILCTKCLLQKDETEFWPTQVELVKNRGWRGTACRACYRRWAKHAPQFAGRDDPTATRICGRCRETKGRESFMPSAWKKAKGVWCRDCHRQYYRDKGPAYSTKYLIRRRHERTAEVQALKAEIGCSRCGEKHPACLDFHHTFGRGGNKGRRNKMISQMVASGWSAERIRTEIAKCEILCSNCHRKHHWDMGGHPSKKRDLVHEPRRNPTMKRSLTTQQ